MRDSLVFGRLLLILAALIALAGLLAVVFRSNDSTKLLLLLLAGSTLGSTIYIGAIWWSDRARPRSLLVGLLLFGAVVVEIGLLVLVPLTYRRLDGEPALPYGAALTTLVLLAFCLVPDVYAIFIFLRRRRRGSQLDQAVRDLASSEARMECLDRLDSRLDKIEDRFGDVERKLDELLQRPGDALR